MRHPSLTQFRFNTHGFLPFCASRLAATFTPFLELSIERLRALMTASDLPNGDPSRMLNAFGKGQILSSMFMLLSQGYPHGDHYTKANCCCAQDDVSNHLLDFLPIGHSFSFKVLR
jgi:hypothetical protein